MLSKVLTTPVDDLVGLLKKKDSVTITDIQKELELPLPTIERWLIILEEFNVLGITYKGFEGIVSLKENEKKKDDIDLDRLKETFIEKAKAKMYSYNKMRELWPVFLTEYKAEIRRIFFIKATQRGFNNKKTEMAWERFLTSLEDF